VTISIRIFDMLDRISKLHRITDLEWAEAANMRRATISELRRVSRVTANGVYTAIRKQICTLEKILKLSEGLSIKVGSTIINLILKNHIESEPNQDVRLQLIIMILQNAPKETKDIAESLLKWPLSNIDSYTLGKKIATA